MVDYKVNNTITEVKAERRRELRSWIDFFVIVLTLLIIVTTIRVNVIYRVVVDGSSMTPTLHSGDYLIGFKVGEIARGDVIVCHSEYLKQEAISSQNGYQMAKLNADGEYLLIKRVVALPGDVITSVNGKIYIKYGGQGEFEPVEDDFVSLAEPILTTVVEPETYFVLGDNRKLGGSRDSREIGLIPFRDVKAVIPQYLIDARYSLSFLYKIL